MAPAVTRWPRASGPSARGYQNSHQKPRAELIVCRCEPLARGGVAPDLSWHDREQKRTPGATGTDPAPLAFDPDAVRRWGRAVRIGGPPPQASPPSSSPPQVSPYTGFSCWAEEFAGEGGGGGGEGGKRRAGGGWRRDGVAPNSALPCLCNLNRPIPSPVRVPRGSAALRCSQAGGGFRLAASLPPPPSP